MIAATTAHIVVDHLLSNDGTIHATVTHEWWELTLAVIGAIAAALAAVWTLILAMQTKRLAEATAIVAKETSLLAQETARLASETRDAIAVSREEMVAEERRHMQSFQPHIAIECKSIMTERQILNRRPPPNNTPYWTEGSYELLEVFARNIGAGYAVNVTESTQNMANNDFDKPPVPIAFAANSEPVLILRRKNGSGSLMGWQLKYEDAFGNRFETNIANGIQVGSRYEFRRAL